MVTEIPLLQNVKVAAPCPASWDAMQEVDGDRVHFCDGCKKKVYNLSAMGQAEAEGLLRKHEGHLCVRYYRRRDGTVLTTDCPVGLQAVRLAMMNRARTAASLAILFLGALASSRLTESHVQGDVGAASLPAAQSQPVAKPPAPAVTIPEHTMGKIARTLPIMGQVAAWTTSSPVNSSFESGGQKKTKKTAHKAVHKERE